MFKKITLPTGVRILTAPMRGTNTLTLLVMCGTGSDYETRAEGGVSHFLEHLFFKGTANRPGPERISQELDQMGSISNAFTDHQTTGYFIKAGTTHAERALDILADIYRNSLFESGELEREKQVVIEEMRRNRDTPTTQVWHLWERLLFGDQPAGWDVSGSEETVRGLSREDVVSYFTHQYVAANTAVVIAGDIDEAAMIERIAAAFSGVRDGAPRPRPPFQSPPPGPRSTYETKTTDQVHALVGFEGYSAFHPRRWAADVLATILGGNMSSRMFLRIREKLGLAYAVFSTSENYSDRGYLVTYSGVSPEGAPRAIEAMLDEYRRVREEGVGGAELGRTKEFLKGRMLMALETSNAVASFVAGEEMLTGAPLTIEEVFATMDAVTAEDLSLVARELIRPERLAAAFIGPAAVEARAGTPDLHAVVRSFS